MKLKGFCTEKDTIFEERGNLVNEKILISYTFDRGLVPEIFKELKMRKIIKHQENKKK